MKLIVFGATGGIGSQVVEQALTAGHEVTAIVRRPNAITRQHKHLMICQGDVLQPATLEQPMIGQDAVISAIGATSRTPTTLYSQGISNIIHAMQVGQVRRLICISASGLEPGPIIQRLVAKPLLWWVLKEMYADLVRMESIVKASNLDWTIMRPPRLTNGPHTGLYKVAVNKHLAGGWFISRADLADYMLTHLVDPTTYRAWIDIAH